MQLKKLSFMAVVAVAICGLSLAGCSSSSGDGMTGQYESAKDELVLCVEASVPDTARAKLAAAKIDEADELVKGIRDKRREQLDALVELNKDYHSSREQFDALLDARAVYVDAKQTEMLALAESYAEAMGDALGSCSDQRTAYAVATLALMREF